MATKQCKRIYFVGQVMRYDLPYYENEKEAWLSWSPEGGGWPILRYGKQMDGAKEFDSSEEVKAFFENTVKYGNLREKIQPDSLRIFKVTKLEMISVDEVT